jgi:acyl-CoA synthetase (AMP-forming)/AMP-acid ligase II/acyl carrier protein
MGPQLHRLTLHDLVKPLQETPVAAPRCMVFTANGVDPVACLEKSELSSGAHAVANGLRQNAVPGTRALISVPTGPEFFTSFFGCLYAGMLAVPVQSVRNVQSLARLEAIAGECGARLFLTSSPIRERVQALDPDFWRRTGMQPFLVDAAQSGGPALEHPVALPGPDEPAYLQFTSGSTGTPRGVIISHANVFSNLAVIDAKAGRPRAGSVASWLPLYHDMGLVSALYALYASLPLVLLSPMHFLQQPWRWLRAISHYGAVYSGAPNFAYESCTRAEVPSDGEPLDLRSWKFAFCGAEMVRPATMRRFAQRFEPFGFRAEALSPAYGLAENTLIVTGVASSQNADARKVESVSLGGECVSPATPASMQPFAEISECGMPGAGHLVRVVDPQRCRTLPDGHMGEIWVTGPSKALGYWQRPEESRAVFEARLEGDNSAYLRTGDLGFLHADRLYVTGRIKELVIIRGRNYHPHEIEEAVRNAHPALSSTAAAFAVTTGDEEKLVVISELLRGARRVAALNEVLIAVQDELVRRLDVKADFIGLAKPGVIPRTSSGKVQRLKCRDQYRAGLLEFLAVWPAPSEIGPETVARPVPPPRALRFVIENWILQWLSFRLRIPVAEIDRRQPLSAYGLDSVAAVQLSQALEDWLELPVSETLAWSYPTIEEVSAYLEQALCKPSPESAGAAEPRRKPLRSQVDLALQWVERLSEPEVELLYSRRLVRE